MCAHVVVLLTIDYMHTRNHLFEFLDPPLSNKNEGAKDSCHPELMKRLELTEHITRSRAELLTSHSSPVMQRFCLSSGLPMVMVNSSLPRQVPRSIY